MLTILTSFKPFRGDDAVRQERALQSWRLAFPECEILAFGKSGDLSEIVAPYGVQTIEDLPLGDDRVPRADAMLNIAQERGQYDLQLYTNADMIYGEDMPWALDAMPKSNYLLIGQRWDWDGQTADCRPQTTDILVGSADMNHQDTKTLGGVGNTDDRIQKTKDMLIGSANGNHKETKTRSACDAGCGIQDSSWSREDAKTQSGLRSAVCGLRSESEAGLALADVERIQRAARETGTLHSALAMDYFGYRRGDIQNLPPYFVGAAEWDNGMVAHALRNRLQVVDLTPSAVAVHQHHDYGYVAGGRAVVFEGALAQQNHGIYVKHAVSHYYGAKDATHVLDGGVVQKARSAAYVNQRIRRVGARGARAKRVLPWRLFRAYCKYAVYAGV